MRSSTRRAGGVVAGSIAIVLATTSCSSDTLQGKPLAGSTPPSAGTTEVPSSTTDPDIAPGDEKHPDGKMVGAPFDPCTVISPDDIPREFQTEDNRIVLRSAPDPEANIDASCDFGHYETVDDPSNNAVVFSVGWNGHDKNVPTPSAASGWKTTELTGRKAIYSDGTNPDSENPKASCSAFAEVSEGIAMVTSVTDGVPELVSCDAALALLTKIVKKAG